MAAQARTVLLCLAALCLPAFANIPKTSLLSEKPHLGVQSFALASHQGLANAKPLIAPGIAECLCDEGRRSRSTGKERDAETGLDYFGARYMSAAQGRFTSPDPHNIISEASSEEEFASYLPNPQNWNRYAYVTNNPLSITDPDGRCSQCFLWLQQLGQRAAPYADKAGQAVSRWGSQAGQAASRYGQQAYVWATQFFNSPTGQEVTAAAAEMAMGSPLPNSPVAALRFKTGDLIEQSFKTSKGTVDMLAEAVVEGKTLKARR